MNLRTLSISLAVYLVIINQTQSQNPENLRTDWVARFLEVPWEILWGPDDHIWFTERPGRVQRLNPETKEMELLLEIAEVESFSEAGLLGMALDPEFESGRPYVYLVYTYFDEELIERLVRYTYDGAVLTAPEILLDNIPAAANHDGSRILFDGDGKLLMTTGDAQNEEWAQDLGSLAGKVLRINPDGSVPDDNPISGSYVFSFGHRNAQGLVLASNGILYSSEHGPQNDDELNIIIPNRNYGWDDVQGYCDNNSENNYCDEFNIVEPILAWTPTLAVAGIDYYNHVAIPDWQNSILMTTLKEDELHVIRLSEDGMEIQSDEVFFKDSFGRLRDVCVSPTGEVYIATSNRDGRANGLFPVNMDDRIIRIYSDSEPLNVTNKEVSIYPNPVTDMLHLNDTDVREMRLYDLTFKLILSVENQNRMSLTTLPKGIYLLKVYTDYGIFAERIMKQ